MNASKAFGVERDGRHVRLALSVMIGGRERGVELRLTARRARWLAGRIIAIADLAEPRLTGRGLDALFDLDRAFGRSR